MTKSEKEKYELIEKFIENTLSKEEKETFDHAMKSDPDFAGEVKAHQEVHEILLDQGILNVKKQLQQIHKEETGRNSTYTKLYSALAVLMITGGIMYYFYQSSKTPVQPIVRKEVKNNQAPSIITENSSKVIVQDDSMSINKQTSAPKKNSIVTSNNNAPLPSISPTDGKDAGGDQTQNTNNTNTTNTTSKAITDSSTAKSKTNSNTNETKPADCSSVRITGNATTKAACKEENNGRIIIQLNSITGGKQQYKFSIDEDSEFTTSSLFDQLSPGSYKIHVIDANGCKNLLSEVTVESIECKPKEDRFYPDANDPDKKEWTIPLKNNANGKLTIINKAGIIVYTVNITNGYPETWNGTDSNGQLLPGGSYNYIISYSNQSISGTVSIIR